MTHASLSEQFKSEHGPGSPGKPAPLTASRWPAVLDLPPEMKSGWPAYLPSKLALALHMTGAVPFDDSDNPLLRRGRYMERFGEDTLRERGWEILSTQYRVAHPKMNALTNLDVLALPPDTKPSYPGQREIVEFKTLDERDYRSEWADGPPLYPQLQIQCQFACCPELRKGQIGAIIRGYKSDDLLLHPVERDDALIEALEHKGQEFLDLIARTPAERLAELLIEEDSPDSLRSWSRIISLPKGTTAAFGHSEAVTRAKRLYQARLDRLAATAIEDAEKNWLAVHAPQAATLELLDGTIIKRTVVNPSEVPAHTRARHVKWDVKPAGEDYL